MAGTLGALQPSARQAPAGVLPAGTLGGVLHNTPRVPAIDGRGIAPLSPLYYTLWSPCNTRPRALAALAALAVVNPVRLAPRPRRPRRPRRC